jgi:hypothetical protein
MPDSALSIAPIADSPGDLIASCVKAAKTWLVCTQLATLEGLLARGGYLASPAANAS